METGMSIWRMILPSIPEVLMGAGTMVLLAMYGLPSFSTAQARSTAAVRPAPASGPTVPPFRMLPSDLDPGGVSKHVPTKGPFLGHRRDPLP